jgi:hypothetical protein
VQQKQCQGTKRIIGVVIISLGILLLCGHLTEVAGRLSDFLGAAPGNVPRLLPIFIVAALRTFVDCALDRHEILQHLLVVSVFLWPLLLVVAGAILLVHACPKEVGTSTSS